MVAVGDVYRLSCLGDWGSGLTGVATLHFKALDPGATTTALASALRAGLLTSLKAQQCTIWNWRQINHLTENVVPPISGQYSSGFPLTGTLAGAAAPFQVSIVASIRTAYAGRSYRGRFYLPGLSINSCSSGSTVTASVLTALQSYFDTLVASYGAAGSDTNWRLVIWSRKLQIASDVTSVIVRDIAATQRRRRPGVGI